MLPSRDISGAVGMTGLVAKVEGGREWKTRDLLERVAVPGSWGLRGNRELERRRYIEQHNTRESKGGFTLPYMTYVT